MSWQSATPVKPIAAPRRPNQNSASPAPRAYWEQQPRPAVSLILRVEETETEAGHVFWIYWDTAWSLIISGIMFTTIVTHPDAEFAEIRAAKQMK